ncbi:ribonuclease P protein subunit RPR2, partial [Phenoliferia sp. Uapishka_3]
MKKLRSAPDEPVAGAVPNKDVLQRLSYLYQASVLLNTALHAGPSTKDRRRKINTCSPPSTAASGSFLIPTQADGRTGEAGDTAGTNEPAAATGQRANTALEWGFDMKGNHLSEVGAVSEQGRSALPATSRVLVQTMREVAKKATVRMDPTVKRTLCKGCGAVLVPGITATVRIKPSGPHAHLIMTTCLGCQRQLRLPAPPHLSEADVEVFNESKVSTSDGETAAGMSASQILDSGSAAKRERWARREKKQARRPTFFDRGGHTTFVAAEKGEKR